MRRKLLKMKLNNRLDLEKYAPPGANFKQQKDFFITGNIISLLGSLYFFVEYFNEYQKLFDYDGEKNVLIEGLKMPDFPLILDKFLVGFLIMAVCMMFYVFFYYIYYYQNGSKSIYLMKRLPKRFEIHKRAWILPLFYTALCLTIGFLLAVFYLCFYLIVTPQDCLLPDQWQKFFLFFEYYI